MIYTVSDADIGKRLDALVAEAADITRSAAQRLIEGENVKVLGEYQPKKYVIRAGDELEITLPEPEESEILPEDIPLDIVYEDSDIIIVNKPSGMVVHPAPGNYSGTLVNALMHHCGDSLSGIGGVIRPGIVHRIDKDTSGLLVVAKNDEAHTFLSNEMKSHSVIREYHALVRGGFKEPCGTVELPIGRHPVDRKRMAVHKVAGAGAKEAITHYEVMCDYGGISYLRLRLETGRTHQIRVHMAHLGHPLLGDEVYGGGAGQFEKKHPSLFDGQALHAKKLTLTHPKSKELLTFECELPDNFKRMLEILDNS